jgi:hypothetical protein
MSATMERPEFDVTMIHRQLADFARAKEQNIDYDALERADVKLAHHIWSYTWGSEVVNLERIRLPVDTSPGVPYRSTYETKGDMYSSWYGRSTLEDWHERAASERLVYYWSVALKDEPKKPEKEPRMFLIEPVQMQYTHAHLASDFNYNLQRVPWVRIGMEMTVSGWQAHLDKLDEACVSLDGTTHERCFSPESQVAISHIRHGAYGPLTWEDNVRFWNVRRNLLNKWIWWDGPFMFSWGNPSGHFCTATDNTIQSMRILYYAWEKYGIPSIDVQDVWKSAVFADDLKVSWDPAMNIDWSPYICEAAQDLGHKLRVTSDGVVSKYEAEFLSHTTRRYMGRNVPVLKDSRLLGHLKWVRDGSLDQQLQSLLGVYNAGVWNPRVDHLYKQFLEFADAPPLRELRASAMWSEGGLL